MKQIFLLVFLLATIVSFSQSKKEQIKILTNRVDSLSQVFNSQSKTIDDKNSQISGLNNKIANLESSISSLNADISILNLGLQGNKNEIATKTQQLSNLQAKLKTKTDSLSIVLGELEKLKPLNTQTGAFKSVKIGTQVWMTENLNVSSFRNGDPIPQAKTEEEWEKAGENEQPAWCYYDNDPANGTKYGKLYNWYAVNDPRGLAPKGWHVPTDAEWTLLTDYLGVHAGSKMKSKSGWKEKNKSGRGNSTNSSGFSGLPGGGRADSGRFDNIGYYGYWFSKEVKDGTDYDWIHYLYYDTGGEYSREVSKNHGHGISVRCLRD
jgi:uncharacterized protein (TIGR02145 family)